MFDFLTHLFDTSGFPPRWHCGDWTAGHGWLHILSDLGVWSAYVAIPCVLGYFVLRRTDIPFRRVFLLFGAFILACGTTHLMEVIIFWWPAYRLAGVIKLFTAIVSWGTVLALVPVTPKALAMRNPEELEREIAARKEAESALQRANAELEARVQERTAELAEVNATLRESQRREKERADELEAILRATPTPIWIAHDPHCHRITGNPASFTLLGLPEGSNVSATAPHRDPAERGFREYRGDEPIPVDELPVQRAARGELVNGAEVKFVFDDGRVRYIYGNAVPLRNPDGGVRGCVAAFADVTPLKEAEGSLRRNQEIFKLVHQIGKIGHWEWNSLTDENKWSPEIEALYGLPPGGFEGGYQGWANLLHPDDLAKAQEDVRHALETGKYFTEFRVIWPDGSVHWLEARAVVFRDAHKSVRIMGVNMDVTERKEMEEALRSTIQQLQDTDRRKDEFLATLAHELRGPLAPLSNALEIIKRADGDSKVLREAPGIMARQLKQLIRLVDDLLDVGRITRNKLELRRKTVELASVIHHAVETCRPMADEAGHNLSVSVPPDPIYISGDPVRLAQVFSNLITNACKYTQQGGRIEMTVERQGSDAVVSVKDNGVGIRSDMLPRIFEMFVQLDQSLERAHGGLGVGLTLVKRLVEMHDGTVFARSEGPAKGSEFVVRLPVLIEPSCTHEPMPGRVSEIPAEARRILVVDDNQDSAASLSMLLRAAGNQTHVAHDGLEALRSADTFRPDVALVDIGMPKLNGYEVARRIREQHWGKNMVLIATTGWGQEEDQRRSKEAGFDRHMVKPIDYEALTKVLAELQPRTAETAN